LWDPGGGRSFNFAAGSRSHRGFFMVTWTFWITALNFLNNIIYFPVNAKKIKPLHKNAYINTSEVER
jgi:hypothetical protein